MCDRLIVTKQLKKKTWSKKKFFFCVTRCNVRAWNLFWASVAKPVLWQLMILLPWTLAHTSSIPMGAINFHMQEHFFTLADTTTPIFTVLTKFLPHANWAVVTHNLTVIIKVLLIEAMLIEGFCIVKNLDRFFDNNNIPWLSPYTKEG